jgi:autotransporter-associated beta strand protein
MPQNGDGLLFRNGDSNRSMTNDLTGLTIHLLSFGFDGNSNDYQLSGNSLTVGPRGTGANIVVSPDGSSTVTLNCPVVFTNGGQVLAGPLSIGVVSQNTAQLHLNGDIMANGGDLALMAENENSDVGGGSNARIYVSGQVSGSGNVVATIFGHGDDSSVTFDGTADNAFTGTLHLSTVGKSQVIFNKSAGHAVNSAMEVEGGAAANLNLNQPDQIGGSTTVTILAGSQLFLSGNDVGAGSLVLSNYSADAAACVLDTGSTLLGLNNGITSWVDNDHVNPVIKGRLNLIGFASLDISGGPEPGLDIQASMGGNGFQKLGDGTLWLSGNNTFFGDAQISAGTVVAYTSTAFGQAGPTYGVELDGGNLVLQGVAIGAEPLFVNSTASSLTAINQCSWAGPVTLNTNLNVVPVDVTDAGLAMNFSGSISGGGGLNLEPALLGVGNVELSGPAGNTFTGPTTVNCQLLELNKPSGVNAYAGPLIVGGAAGTALHEARWLNSYQNVYATLTLYANGYVNLTNNNEDFGAVTFNGGTVDSGPSGQFAIYAPLTVNPADSSAVINGNLGLPSGGFPPTLPGVFMVGAGAAACDLIVNATVFGSPQYFVKQGPGTMCLTGGNTYDAVTLLEEGILDVNNGSALGTDPGLVIFGGATLRLEGSGNFSGGFEVVGAGVGGTHGAVEATPNSTFTFAGGILLDAATTLNVGASAQLGLNGGITGSGPLLKAGAGALVMSGGANNTYSGDTLVSAGSLLLSKSANRVSVPGNLVIGPGPAGPVTYARLFQAGGLGGTTVTVNGNSLLDLNGNNAVLTQLTLNDGGYVQTGDGTLNLADGSSVNVGSLSAFGSHAASSIAGSLALPVGATTFNVAPHAPTPPLLFGPELDVPAAISGGSTVQLTVMDKYGLGQMQLDGNNSYASATRVYEGTLIAANGGALGSTSGSTYVYNGASLALDGGISIGGEFVVLDSTNAAALDSRAGANTWGGSIYLNRNSVLNVNNALAATGVIQGPGGLIEAGPGTLTLGGSGGNTYAGVTTVNQGTLLLNKPIAVTAVPGPLTVGSAAGSSAIARNLNSYQIVGNIYVNSGGLYDVNGQQENVDYLELDGSGTVQTGAGYLSLKTSGSINVYPGSNTTATLNGYLVLDPGNHVVTVGSGGAAPGVNDLVVNAGISQTSTAASIQKEGAGRMRLTAANSYTGSTTVNGGTLQVDGAQPQSTVVVNNGTLQGSGSVGPLYLTASTATVAPGESPGILTCANFDSFGGSGTLKVELNGTTPGSGYAQLNARGAVNLTGVSLNASLGYASAVNDQFTIINNGSSGPVGGTFTGLAEGAALYIGGEKFEITYKGGAGNDVVLTRLVTPQVVLHIESVEAAHVRLFWSTNDPELQLQFNTDPGTTNWAAAAPLPVVAGTNFTVTNTAYRVQKLYRLSRLPASYTPPPPALTIQRASPGSIRLLWPADDPVFRLQSNTNLGTTNWVTVTQAPVIVVPNNVVTNAITGPASFYRLSKP